MTGIPQTQEEIRAAVEARAAEIEGTAETRRSLDALCRWISRSFPGLAICGNILPRLTGYWIRAFG